MTTGGELQAGCATADITPPVGVDMGGYWERASGAQQIRDPLAAKAVAFAAGSRRIGLIALDLVGLDRGTVLEIRRRVEDETGLSPGALMVCCSHTHSGPLTLSFQGMGTVDSQYLRTLTETAVRMVAAAADRLSPATLRHATAAVDIGRNRRLESTDAPAGYAHVVQIDGAAGPLATIFSYGCHPVALGQDNNAVSADFIGVAARFLESSGNPAMFLNGACGDINPRKSIGRLDDVEELGCELGTAIAKARTVARALPAGDVGHFTESVDLPLLEPPAATAAYLDHLRLVCKARFMRMFMDGAESRRVQQATVNGRRSVSPGCETRTGSGIKPLRFRVLVLVRCGSWEWKVNCSLPISRRSKERGRTRRFYAG